jgi:hypothetical protein
MRPFRVWQIRSDCREASRQQQKGHVPSERCSRRNGNDLAHQINNPLSNLTNTLFLPATGHNGSDGKIPPTPDLQRLASLVKRLLAFPR